MNQQIRNQLIDALRSGLYPRTVKQLRKKIEPETVADLVNVRYRYCVLGVLADLYIQNGMPSGEVKWDGEGLVATDKTRLAMLPEFILGWAGLMDQEHLYLFEANVRAKSFYELIKTVEII